MDYSVKRLVEKTHSRNNKVEQVWFYILVAIIYLLGAMFTKLTYLDLDKLGVFLCTVVLIGGFIERRMKFDIALLFLFQAMFIVSYTDSIRQNNYDVCYGWILVSTYLIGKYAVGNNKETANKRAVITYFALALGLLTTGIVDLIYNYKIDYYDTEWLISIWTDETVGRTVYDLYGILMVSAIAYLVMESKKHKVFTVVGILLALYYLFEMVRHEGRYCLFVLLLLVPIIACLLAYDKWPEVTSGTKKILFKILIALIAVFLLACILFNVNVFGIKDLYQNSYISGSGGIVHNVRFQYAMDAMKNIPDHLQGGYDDELPRGAHNTWLEFGSKFGVIVWILLECFRVVVIFDGIKLLLSRKIGKIKYLLVPSFIFINLYYSMEPIGFRRRLYFMFLLVLFAVVKRVKENME